MAEIVMPRLSDSMTEGTVVRWLKGPGDPVRRGEPIVEIETDKATITYEADLEGTIGEILVGEGQTVAVGATIATIVDAAGASQPQQAAPQPQPTAAPEAQAPAPLPLPAEPPATAPAPLPVPPDEAPAPAPAEDAAPASGGRVKASPIARRLARKLGVDLANVPGTGPGGRIVKEDVEAAAGAQAAPPPPADEYEAVEQPAPAQQPPPSEPAPPPPAPPPAAPQPPPPMPPPPAPPASAPAPPPAMPPLVAPAPAPLPPPVMPPGAPAPGVTGPIPAIQPGGAPTYAPGVPLPGAPLPGGAMPGAPAPQATGATATRGQASTVEPSHAQQIVARRMAEAKATVPHYQVEVEVDMTAVQAMREQLRYTMQPAPTLNDFIVKASALALRQFPRINAAYRDGRFEYYSDVNVGVVVSAGELLAVPIVFNADQKGLAQIARESHELAAAVRGRTISPAQLSGGTFSVSNLGMFGVSRFNAIINPPQAAILAVGAAIRRPVVAEDGFSLQVRPIMTLTLSCDHRILYGHEAAEFLGAIKSWLENPQAMPV